MTAFMTMKKGLSYCLDRCGLSSAFERYRLRDKAFVLMYHRVLEPEYLQDRFVQSGMYVLRSTFEKHVSYLNNRYRVLFLEDLLEKAEKGESIGGCCAITFDDGWLDNYTNAFPVLKKYGVPATIFLATGFLGTGRLFWPDELCLRLKRCGHAGSSYHGSFSAVLRFRSEMEKDGAKRQEDFWDRAIEVLKGFTPGERIEVLDCFRGTEGADQLPRQILAWEEAIEMGNSGLVRFGAHTAGHEILDRISPESATMEIRQSKHDIESRLGARVSTFAYPNGNYNRYVLESVRENGFRCAVTTRRGYWGKGTRPFEIPRIGLHEDVSNSVSLLRSRILFRKF